MMRRGTIASMILAVAMSASGANPAPAPASATVTTAIDADSHQTRDELKSLLRRYPPEVGVVLKLDPTLFGNQAYLANYPALTSFIAQHPEVAHNPGFFLQSVSLPRENNPDPPSMQMWRVVMGDLGAFAVFLVVTSVLIWMVRTLIEQRRWSRLSRVQTEVHSKLLDRFTSNEELLAYIQTPAGRRFFESAPIPLEAGPKPVSAPVGRILWSLQAGLVAAAGGIGLVVAAERASSDAKQLLFGIGVIAICVGIAFVLSAIAFYGLSRKFGLWEPPSATPSES